MKTREISFVCNEEKNNSLNIHIGEEPKKLRFEVDDRQMCLYWVFLDIEQIREMHEELSAWLGENS